MCQCELSGDDARKCYPSDLTDKMWEILQPLLPVRDLYKGGKPRKYGDRLVLNAIFYVLRSGCQWRMLPHDLMPFDAAHRWFSTWRKNGTWKLIHDELRDQVRLAAGRSPQPTAAIMDAQSIKSSDGGRQRGFDAGKKTTGRKRHIIVDTLGLILVVMVTSASMQDPAGGRQILARLAGAFNSIKLIWGDGGYANSVNNTLLGWAKTQLDLVVQIIKRTDDTKGFTVLPRRWVVERTFAWLVTNRRLARDYERLTATSETMILVAMIRLMTIRLAKQQASWSTAGQRKATHQRTLRFSHPM